MPSHPNPENSLTIANASSTPYTWTIMTWAAVILTPVVDRVPGLDLIGSSASGSRCSIIADDVVLPEPVKS